MGFLGRVSLVACLVLIRLGFFRSVTFVHALLYLRIRADIDNVTLSGRRCEFYIKYIRSLKESELGVHLLSPLLFHSSSSSSSWAASFAKSIAQSNVVE